METGEPQLQEKEEEENLHNSLQKKEYNLQEEENNLQEEEENLQTQVANLHTELKDLMQRKAEAALKLVEEGANREHWRAVQMNLEERKKKY